MTIASGISRFLSARKSNPESVVPTPTSPVEAQRPTTAGSFASFGDGGSHVELSSAVNTDGDFDGGFNDEFGGDFEGENFHHYDGGPFDEDDYHGGLEEVNPKANTNREEGATETPPNESPKVMNSAPDAISETVRALTPPIIPAEVTPPTLIGVKQSLTPASESSARSGQCSASETSFFRRPATWRVVLPRAPSFSDERRCAPQASIHQFKNNEVGINSPDNRFRAHMPSVGTKLIPPVNPQPDEPERPATNCASFAILSIAPRPGTLSTDKSSIVMRAPTPQVRVNAIASIEPQSDVRLASAAERTIVVATSNAPQREEFFTKKSPGVSKSPLGTRVVETRGKMGEPINPKIKAIGTSETLQREPFSINESPGAFNHRSSQELVSTPSPYQQTCNSIIGIHQPSFSRVTPESVQTKPAAMSSPNNLMRLSPHIEIQSPMAIYGGQENVFDDSNQHHPNNDSTEEDFDSLVSSFLSDLQEAGDLWQRGDDEILALNVDISETYATTLRVRGHLLDILDELDKGLALQNEVISELQEMLAHN